MISLHATYLKFAEYVDKLVQIVYAEFKNDREKAYWVHENKKTFFIVCIPIKEYSS